MSNVPSMMHLVAGFGIERLSALWPRIRANAPRIMDFPAPVSPVITEKLCAKAKIDVVNLVDGVLSQPLIFDEAFKKYL